MKDHSLLPAKTVFLGFDPGDIGFICLYDGVDFIFHQMPTHKVETGKMNKAKNPIMKDEFCLAGFISLAHSIKDTYKGFEIIAAIEDVHAIHGASAEATFNFGYTVGMQNLFLELIGAKITRVSPKKWQIVMWRGYEVKQVPSKSGKTLINDTKATSELVAVDLFPEMDFRKNERCRTNDDNKIDSLLICIYAMKNHLNKLL